MGVTVLDEPYILEDLDALKEKPLQLLVEVSALGKSFLLCDVPALKAPEAVAELANPLAQVVVPVLPKVPVILGNPATFLIFNSHS